MKYFRGSYLSIVVVLFIIGCVDRKEEWIEHYAMAKCSWQKEENALASDSVKFISPLVMEMEKLQSEKGKIAAPFNGKIKDLENQIKDEQKKYKKEYRKLTDAHNEKYGHVSTPEYEKALIKIQNNSNNRIASIQKKIKTINDEMQSNGEY
jgi:DnaJ-domain-containing protein 1